MQRADFLGAYTRDRTDYLQTHQQNQDLAMWDSASHTFGMVLYDVLATGERQAISEDWLDHYMDCSQGLFEAYPDMALDISTQDDCKVFQHLGSHALTYAMSEAWHEFGAPPVEPRSREDALRIEELRISQDYLSLLAGGLYVRRDMLMARNPHYLDPHEENNQRDAIEGVLHEIDTAMVGLAYAIRHAGTSIVPSPLQFERLAAGRRENCDFVMLDTVQETAVGLQVKANVRKKDLQEYDQSRIILIDANTELGGRRRLRTQRRQEAHVDNKGKKHEPTISTEIQEISWGGVLGALHFTQLRSGGGRASKSFKGTDEVTMARSKMRVRQSLGAMKVDPNRMYSMVAYRIEAGLAPNHKHDEPPTPSSIARMHSKPTVSAMYGRT